MIQQENIALGAPIYIEREYGFHLSECGHLQQGHLFFINEDGQLPQIRRAVSDPQPIFNIHKHIIEWHVEATYEI
jgi:hypothetical protein